MFEGPERKLAISPYDFVVDIDDPIHPIELRALVSATENGACGKPDAHRRVRGRAITGERQLEEQSAGQRKRYPCPLLRNELVAPASTHTLTAPG